jgi:hypothetical protein
MFESLLNKELRSFIKRATNEISRWQKNSHWQNNVFVIDNHTYYVEYYQERLYWVYDYNKEKTIMVYANSPSEAVKIARC